MIKRNPKVVLHFWSFFIFYTVIRMKINHFVLQMGKIWKMGKVSSILKHWLSSLSSSSFSNWWSSMVGEEEWKDEKLELNFDDLTSQILI